MSLKESSVIDDLLPLPGEEPAGQVLLLPSWFDPGFMVRTCQYTPAVYTLPPGQPVKVASNNPRRWAIGFQLGVGVATPTTISNDTDPQLFGSLVTSNIADNWYKQFKYGPMPQWEWWAFAAGGSNLKVIEIELQ